MNTKGLAQAIIENEEQEKEKEILKEALELLQYFVTRVEEGTIRSRVTYKKYKTFLDKVK